MVKVGHSLVGLLVQKMHYFERILMLVMLEVLQLVLLVELVGQHEVHLAVEVLLVVCL